MYKRITKSLSHHIDSALRLHFSRRNERVPAEVCPVVYFAGTPVAIAISVRLRLCPPKPSASLHPGASRHPFTWPWAAMGSGGHSLQPSSFRFDCTLSRLSATAEAGMKRSGIDRPGAAGVIRGQSPRKSALPSPPPLSPLSVRYFATKIRKSENPKIRKSENRVRLTFRTAFRELRRGFVFKRDAIFGAIAKHAPTAKYALARFSNAAQV